MSVKIQRRLFDPNTNPTPSGLYLDCISNSFLSSSPSSLSSSHSSFHFSSSSSLLHSFLDFIIPPSVSSSWYLSLTPSNAFHIFTCLHTVIDFAHRSFQPLSLSLSVSLTLSLSLSFSLFISFSLFVSLLFSVPQFLIHYFSYFLFCFNSTVFFFYHSIWNSSSFQ